MTIIRKNRGGTQTPQNCSKKFKILNKMKKVGSFLIGGISGHFQLPMKHQLKYNTAYQLAKF